VATYPENGAGLDCAPRGSHETRDGSVADASGLDASDGATPNGGAANATGADAATSRDAASIADAQSVADAESGFVPIDPHCGVPTNAAIELRFDRYLLPSTASRASIAVFTGRRSNSVFFDTNYDPLERVVTFRPSYGSKFLPGVVYEVQITVPDAAGSAGFRAFDGAPLAPYAKGGPLLTFVFRTAVQATATAPTVAPSSCRDVLAAFARGGCPSCHSSQPDTTFGLALDSGAALAQTAIQKVARETEDGPYTGRPATSPLRFGVAMPLILPDDPGSSYLFYTLLSNPKNFAGDGACTTEHIVPLPNGTCVEASVPEEQRLHDAFASLNPMPPPDAALGDGIADLRLIERFIAAGAPTDDCRP
jgi:hypothetical protein